MIAGLIRDWRAKRALKALEQHPLYRDAMIVIKGTFADSSFGLGKYASEELRSNLVADILRDVSQIIVADDQRMANREKLAAAVLMFAKYQVLILPPATEEPEDVTRLRGKPGITGELKAHLSEIAQHDKEIKELAWGLREPSEPNILEACVFRYWVNSLRADVFQALRVALKDCHTDPSKDWYRPFVEAMCAWEEHNYRTAIGLPDVLAQQDSHGSLAALKYSTFMDKVLDGSQYPNFEWSEHFRRQ